MITIKEQRNGEYLYGMFPNSTVIEVKIESGNTVVMEEITISEAKEMRDQLDDAIRSITRHEVEDTHE